MKNFFKLLDNINSKKELNQLLELLFTEKELHSLEERIKIIQEIHRGKTQRQVASELNCSVVTVTRGAKAYNKNKDFVKKLLD